MSREASRRRSVRTERLVNSARVSRPLETLTGRPLALFCGIGNPQAFRQTLLHLGGAVVAFRTFADHHAYTPRDLEALGTWAGQQARDCVIVTTQKDLVKLPLTQLGERELWALRVRLHFTAGQEVLDRKLKEALG